jgi:hypothetical protein
MMILGIVIIAIILITGYFYKEELKQIWEKHNKKIIAFALASSAATGGLMVIPSLELGIDDYLITSPADYEELGYNFSRVKNPIFYEREVLVEGNLPLGFHFKELSKDVDVREDFITLAKEGMKGVQDLDLKVFILVREDYTYEEPIYVSEKYTYTVNYTEAREMGLYDGNETGVKEETSVRDVISHYEERSDYHYIWKELDSVKDMRLTRGERVIINVKGSWEASLEKKEVDIIPTLNIDSYSKTYTKYAWWSANWRYKKEITINSSQVPSTLSNFPVCIDITDTDLRDNAQSDGDDIAFTNADEDTQLNHKIEYWDNTTGELVAWVNVTSLTHDTDTIIYMYYGNDAASNQENPSEVFDFDDPDLSSGKHTIDTNFNGACSVYACDVDGDGDIDILGAAYVADDITWWENDGSEGFTEHTIDASFNGATSVYACDVDGDGDIDILGAAYVADDITWWENDGNESFTKHTIDTNFNGAFSVYACDVDGDGDIDILGAAAGDNKIAWWENDGNESFTKHTIDGSFDGAFSVYACDVDGDGDIDVLGTAQGDDEIAWWENDGSEGFTEHTIDTNFDGARSVYACDVDGDGDIDILGAAYVADEIAWWESSAAPSDADWQTTYSNNQDNCYNGGFFSVGSEETGNPISNTNIVPSNGATNVETKPKCNFTAVHNNGASMTVYWKDESYNTIQTNNSVSNNTNVVLPKLSYAWKADTEYTFHINTTDSTNWSNDTISFTTKSYYYNETIRNDGIDYFTWLDNEPTTASDLKDNYITGLDSSSEYIQVWNASTWDTNTWMWETYFGNGSGTDFNINEFDVIRVNLDDSGTQEISMVRDVDYIKGRTVYLNKTDENRGYNYTSYGNEITEYIGTIASNIGLDTGEVISWWDDSNYEWNGYIVDISPAAYNITVSGRAIFETKVGTNKIWNIP